MAAYIKIPTPRPPPIADDIIWNDWLQSPPTSPQRTENLWLQSPPPSPRLTEIAAAWSAESRSPPLRSPSIVRPYGIDKSEAFNEASSQCYFTIGNSQAVHFTVEEPTQELGPKQPEPQLTRHLSVITSLPLQLKAESPRSALSPLSNRSPTSAFSPLSCTSTANKKRKISIEDPIHIQQVIGQAGVPAGSMIQWGNRERGRSAMDDQRKKQYRKTRDEGACPVCRKRRKRCNRGCMPYIECLNAPQLVFLDRPIDAKLFRLRPAPGHPLLSTKPEIYSLTNFGLSAWTIHNSLSQGFGYELDVELCEFEAHPDLKTAYVYHKSSYGLVHVELPRLCLANTERARSSIETYIHNSWCSYLRNIIINSEAITREVLRNAQIFAINSSQGQNSLVGRALKLLAINRMIEVKWTMTGHPVANIPIINDRESPLFGQRPITPVMDTQLDQIIIQNFLQPLRQSLLNDLQIKMDQGRKQDWFEIFLTVFILQTNTTLLLRHSRHNAITCGAATRYQSIQLAQEYFHGSNILLAHFHYQCRGVAKLLESGQVSKAQMADHEKQFLKTLVPSVHAQRERLVALQNDKMYETDLYWAQQMFFGEWTPESKEIL